MMKRQIRWSVGVVPLLEAGVNIIGGCCGSTPDHIRAFRRSMDTYFAAQQAHQHP
jgi:Methionine synthase I (cobalamin-dependent), methyltransferase domain